MFYKCPKCQKVWQHPIGKCPECFLELERRKSEKIRVIGISKVTIPTMFHPKVPYFVLVLEDEKGNKWVQKSVKECKIGDEFHVTRKGNVTLEVVAIWRIKYDILEGIEKVIEFLGELKIDTQTKILILPTLIAPVHPHFAENTSPQFLESTIKYLEERGAKLENIKVSGQSFDEIPIEASAQKSQLLKVCQGYKIMPLDLAKTNFVKKSEGDFSFEISEEVFNSDLIINLPILKMGKISATENILKFLKKENYLGLKYLYSDEEIIKNLNKIFFRYLTLAEAQSVQKPDQFVAHLGLIFASFNSLNLDRVFAEVSMVKELPKCLKKVKIEDIPIVGRKVEELQYEAEKY
ncbi:MAG: hypothetical protein COU43_03105 [Candidatus Nealsonbacteria bacterium CG10_big_fil_rev_8_21_14_0_10_37_25]|uniref:DUF362 domain-containing protein n=3 Tax=Bacteria candidate phyla TaxID=1783234 RepID=A0A2H0TII7_9BACT|nr:MAG: hypothetical protein COU43_03105 [Candidatus Nealsonbacteria bacterium CG10_big_fil_rev_8_21_14_0_10_37_25]